jgi:nitrite reductase/ring-hydroxylating ferredoxin subunit
MTLGAPEASIEKLLSLAKRPNTQHHSQKWNTSSFRSRNLDLGPMLRRSLRKLSSTTTPLVTSLPSKVYTDPNFYEIERKNLLGKKWQLIGHESQLPFDQKIPASYLAETISNYPTILIRSGKTGEIKGYHNVCRHRAGPLEWDGTKGTCSIHGLKCKYHGWTYSVDGELKGVPTFGTTCSEPLNKTEYNLWPMRVAVWRGLIFLQQLPDLSKNISMSGSDATEAFIRENQGFCDRLASVPLEEFRVHSTSTHEIKCNWKVYVENYLEGYHIPMIHPLLNSQVDMNDYAVHVGEGYVEHTTTTSQSNYEVSASTTSVTSVSLITGSRSRVFGFGSVHLSQSIAMALVSVSRGLSQLVQTRPKFDTSFFEEKLPLLPHLPLRERKKRNRRSRISMKQWKYLVLSLKRTKRSVSLCMLP